MSPLPDYYTIWHKAGHYGLRVMAALVLIFLMLPILVIMPLSFNAEPFFTFTQGMLSLDPDAYSTRWYQEIVDGQKWRIAIRNSFLVGIAAIVTSTAVVITCIVCKSELAAHRSTHRKACIIEKGWGTLKAKKSMMDLVWKRISQKMKF